MRSRGPLPIEAMVPPVPMNATLRAITPPLFRSPAVGPASLADRSLRRPHNLCPPAMRNRHLAPTTFSLTIGKREWFAIDHDRGLRHGRRSLHPDRQQRLDRFFDVAAIQAQLRSQPHHRREGRALPAPFCVGDYQAAWLRRADPEV